MAAASDEMQMVENEVMMWVPELEAVALEEIVDLIAVTIPDPARGSKNALLKLLLRHLLTLDAENAPAVFRQIHTHLTKDPPDQKPPTVVQEPMDRREVKSEDGVKDGSSKKTKPGTVVDVFNLRELKINGTIGGMGEKDKLSYTGLSFQIDNARKQGYSEAKNCSAVVKAICPSDPLRNYFESIPDLTMSSVIEIIRSHFKEKDSAATFTELSNTKQLGTESCLEFVLRILFLRNKVLSASTEEGCPYNQKVLIKRFHQTLFNGMRNQNIRAELRENIKVDSVIPDQDLIKIVSEAVKNETERSEKFCVKKTVNAVESEIVENSGKEKEKNKNTLPAQIESMRLSHEREMAALKADLNEIKSVLRGKPALSETPLQRDENNSRTLPSRFQTPRFRSNRSNRR